MFLFHIIISFALSYLQCVRSALRACVCVPLNWYEYTDVTNIGSSKAKDSGIDGNESMEMTVCL